MSQVWYFTLASVIIVSTMSLVGILIIVLKQGLIKSLLVFLISFAAGAMLGDVFIHLLPELAEGGHLGLMSSAFILLGILLFFILEKILHWRHCHLTATESHVHPLAFMNLVGDAVHNFTDGVLIAGSYLLSIPAGIATTIAVILHEIPQEMGDFGVLLHAGMKVKKALIFNFLSALTAIIGALLVLSLGVGQENVEFFIIPITMGGFLYIANADLIPELHKELEIKKSLTQLLGFLMGVAIMFLILFLPFHSHDADHAHGSHFENETVLGVMTE